ncbi:MAG: DsrE family protein [Gammaproteobacteria bacterium]|nr:DsrE family protein [Gammaproteobacteria bacterium]MDH5346032.1 DsrE family protein [Gammaproteobacteria bacterium]
MKLRTILPMILALMICAAHAAEPVAGPYVTAGGPAFKVEDRDVPLREGMKYRVVFEATEYPGEMSDVNRELTVVGRFMNMHGQNGVPLENLDVAVVLHGQALLAAMNEETYREMHGIANPNLALIESLADAGVRFYACGQSLGFRGLDKSVLAEPVKVGLSAMTMLVTLQADGYAFLP